MSELVIRLGTLVLVSLLIWGIVWAGRRFVDIQRQRVLKAAPPVDLAETIPTASTPVRILAFSSEDCHQCHTLQKPALQRVLAARSSTVTVVDVDAPSSPALVERYRVLTVPTTVVLDVTGRAIAVNYGFANSQRLLNQVDGVLTQLAS